MILADDFIGVILAAGSGRRLLPLTEDCPKPLLPICNKPIIQYQIDWFREVGIKKIVIVVGKFYDSFKEIVDCNTSENLSIELIKQEQQLGIAHAFYTAKNSVDRPVLLVLGDTFVFPNPFPSMISIFRENMPSGVLAAQIENNHETIKRNYAIIADKNRRVHKVIEKPAVVTTSLKGCGVYLFNQSFFDAVRRTPRTAMRNEYELTDSVQLFIEDGYRVEVWDGIKREINITTPKDFLNFNLEMLDYSRLTYLIGPGTSIPKNVQINRSVIGANVQIKECDKITNSVLFNNTYIINKKEINNMIIYNKKIINI